MFELQQRRVEQSGKWPLRAVKSVSAALALILPVALFLPFQIHAANSYEFDLALVDLAPDLVLLATIMVTVMAVVLAIAPGRWHERLVTTTIGLAIAVWAQGQILVWEYGALDGTAPEWSDFRLTAVVDTMMWLLVIVVTVLSRKLIYSQAIAIALALIAIQAIPALGDYRDRPEIPDFHRYQFGDTFKFDFSRQGNVIVLMLDAFQSDFFQKILIEEPEIAQSLDGFTYFRNALAGYSKTYPSVALMMSGRWYENEVPIQRFVEDSFENGSVPAELIRAGWQVHMFPHAKRVVHASPQVASNAVPVHDCATARSESGWLLDLGFFRVSPHWLKPYWLNDYDWRVSGALPRTCGIWQGPAGSEPTGREWRSDSPHAAVRFLENARTGMTTDSESRVFKFYHFMIPHAPFKLDEELNVTNLPPLPEGYRRQSRSAVAFVERFLDMLKANGVYDNSMIFIVSDHGGGEYVESVDLGLLPDDHGRSDVGSNDIPGKHLASGLPLVLIKRPDEAGNLKISDAPVSLADIASTIAGQVGLSGEYPGEDVYQLEEGATRVRRYMFYEFQSWQSEYLRDMIEYEVEGFSWSPDAWRRSGRVFSSSDEMSRSEWVEVPVDRNFGFRPTTGLTGILAEGWSAPQDDGLVWSREREATIEFRLPDLSAQARSIHFDIMPFLARGAISSAQIRVAVNGRPAGEWRVDDRGWQSIELPPTLDNDGRISLTFEFPDADAPVNHGYSLDRRLLGMALFQMRISTHER